MFSYMFKPENGNIVGQGIRERKAMFLLGLATVVEDVCFILTPQDELRVTVGWKHYLFKDVKREELGKKLEWFVTQKDSDLEAYKMKWGR